jgi:hypothetical protein
MTGALVYVADGHPGLGRLARAELAVVAVGPADLVLADVTVSDARGGHLIDGGDDLCFSPAGGGGPLCDEPVDGQARAFGIVNVAYHAQRAMRFAADLLGRRLPHLRIRVGTHEDQRWGGGHYRLPSPATSTECGPVAPAGEVHLGRGASFVRWQDALYFHAPAHHAAIIYHEVGHHICRHTADFRLNCLRDPQHQTSRKIALDEGTADYISAVLTGTADIYGWHRGHLPDWDRRRRRLDPQWTMKWFNGGDSDPHADGTVWASALWSARQAVAATGADPGRMDEMVLRGMWRLGQQRPDRLAETHLRQRRHFSRLVDEIVATGPSLAPVVLAAMSEHGIEPGASNAELRDRSRADDVARRP